MVVLGFIVIGLLLLIGRCLDELPEVRETATGIFMTSLRVILLFS